MSFPIGAVVRFTARFVSLGKPRDPNVVTATITVGESTTRYTARDGDVVRRGKGVYSIDHRVLVGGSLVVRFDGDKGFGEVEYDVAGEVRSTMHAPIELPDETDEGSAMLADLVAERARKIERLSDLGIDTDGRSDAFIDACFEQVEGSSPRAKYLASIGRAPGR